MKNQFKSLYPHLIAIGVFLLLSVFVFFFPVLKGKDLKQMDITHTKGMARELHDYKDKTGKIAQWTNSMFSGMPAYLIMGDASNNIFHFLTYVFRFKLADLTIAILFSYLLWAYFLLVALKFDPWLSVLGAITITFGSYNLIIIAVGHVTKAYAIAFIPVAISGIIFIFNSNYFKGLLIAALAIGLEISASHPQITFYLGLIIALMVVCYSIVSIKSKDYKNLAIKISLVITAFIIGVLPNLGALWSTNEYAQYSIRGPAEISNPSEIKKSTGLDRDYAFSWSYGIKETGTLLIPNFVGGSSNEDLGEKSNTYKILKDNGIPNAKDIVKNMPAYWGDRPFTSGPVYVGAIACFFFILGLFIIKGPVKWWIVSATILSLFLAWGKNFSLFNDLMFYYFPYYNKFRTVEMALVIAGFTIPFLGFLALKKIIEEKNNIQNNLKALNKSVLILGGITLIFALMPQMFFDFKASGDAQLKASGFPDWLIEALRADRKGMFRADAIRSLIFIGLGYGAAFVFLRGKITKLYLYAGLTIFTFFDLVPVGKRYLNDSIFVPKKNVVEAYVPTPADLEILKDKDPHYRVYNLTVSPFNDASTSYFHKSVGGYHAAKIRRYQDLYDRQLSQGNTSVINMLNTKYYITSREDKVPKANYNPEALGNAWFVNSYKIVENADSEINALTGFNPSKVAIVDKRFSQFVSGLTFSADSSQLAADQIKLTDYKPDELIYESISSSDKLAVFSEVYYEKGWNAYIDGVLTPHFRVNYVLRAMKIPKGNHKIEFKFESKAVTLGSKISTVGSSVFLLLVLIFGWMLYKKYKTEFTIPS